jgi:hypothetical protein
MRAGSGRLDNSIALPLAAALACREETPHIREQ